LPGTPVPGLRQFRGARGAVVPCRASAGMTIPAPPTALIPGRAPRLHPPASDKTTPVPPAPVRGVWGDGRTPSPHRLLPPAGVQRGQRPLFGFRREDTPGATHRPHPRPRPAITAVAVTLGGPSENVLTMSWPLGRGKNRGGRVPPPSKRIHSIAMLIGAPLSASDRNGCSGRYLPPNALAQVLRQQRQTRVRGVQRGRIAGRPLCQGVRGAGPPACVTPCRPAPKRIVLLLRGESRARAPSRWRRSSARRHGSSSAREHPRASPRVVSAR